MPLCAETYTNKEHGFAIGFPAGWQIKSSRVENTIIKAVYNEGNSYPSLIQNGHSHLAIISVTAYPRNSMGLGNDVWKVSEAVMFEFCKSESPGSEMVLLDSGRTLVGGEHAIWLLVDGRSPSIEIYSRTYYVVRKRLLFRISTTTDRERAWYAQHDHAFQSSVASFRFVSANMLGPANIPKRGENDWVDLGAEIFILLVIATVGGVLKAGWGRLTKRRNHEKSYDDEESGEFQEEESCLEVVSNVVRRRR